MKGTIKLFLVAMATETVFHNIPGLFLMNMKCFVMKFITETYRGLLSLCSGVFHHCSGFVGQYMPYNKSFKLDCKNSCYSTKLCHVINE